MDDQTNPARVLLEQPRFALGIDVSKGHLELALLTDAERLHTKSVSNRPAGFNALVTWLARVTDSAAPAQVHACLEASGGYEEEAALFLHEAGFVVSLVNPRQIKAYADVQLRRAKTDRADAALIARFCQRERPAPWHPPTAAQRQLRQLTRALEALKQDRDRWRNRRQDGGPVAEAFEAVLATLEEQITALENQIEVHLGAHPELARQRDLLVSIPGIGALTAAVVLSELGDIGRFESARQAAAYAGLVPTHHHSGTSVHRPSRLSKVGNSRLRRALYFPSLSAMRHNAAVKVLADRLLARGKQRMTVVGASMRKLLHICYGVLDSGRPFDASLHPTT